MEGENDPSNKGSERLDSCIWLTEEQIDEITSEQAEKRDLKHDRGDDGRSGTQSRRQLVSHAFLLWSRMPIEWKFQGTHSESMATSRAS